MHELGWACLFSSRVVDQPSRAHLRDGHTAWIRYDTDRGGKLDLREFNQLVQEIVAFQDQQEAAAIPAAEKEKPAEKPVESNTPKMRRAVSTDGTARPAARSRGEIDELAHRKEIVSIFTSYKVALDDMFKHYSRVCDTRPMPQRAWRDLCCLGHGQRAHAHVVSLLSVHMRMISVLLWHFYELECAAQLKGGTNVDGRPTLELDEVLHLLRDFKLLPAGDKHAARSAKAPLLTLDEACACHACLLVATCLGCTPRSSEWRLGWMCTSKR